MDCRGDSLFKEGHKYQSLLILRKIDRWEAYCNHIPPWGFSRNVLETQGALKDCRKCSEDLGVH